jgi:hypothetical protein
VGKLLRPGVVHDPPALLLMCRAALLCQSLWLVIWSRSMWQVRHSTHLATQQTHGFLFRVLIVLLCASLRSCWVHPHVCSEPRRAEGPAAAAQQHRAGATTCRCIADAAQASCCRHIPMQSHGRLTPVVNLDGCPGAARWSANRSTRQTLAVCCKVPVKVVHGEPCTSDKGDLRAP